MVVEEIGMGIVEDKVIKNYFVLEYIYNVYKDIKICGVIEKDEVFGFIRIVELVGVLLVVILIINFILIVIFKFLIVLKIRNGIIFFFYLRVKNCIIEVVRVVYDVVVKVGVLKGFIGWVDVFLIELINVVMVEVDFILVIGGFGMVKFVYFLGKLVVGVGFGNVFVIIDESVDIKMVVSLILVLKLFDNGMICVFE